EQVFVCGSRIAAAAYQANAARTAEAAKVHREYFPVWRACTFRHQAFFGNIIYAAGGRVFGGADSCSCRDAPMRDCWAKRPKLQLPPRKVHRQGDQNSASWRRSAPLHFHRKARAKRTGSGCFFWNNPAPAEPPAT